MFNHLVRAAGRRESACANPDSAECEQLDVSRDQVMKGSIDDFETNLFSGVIGPSPHV